MGSVFVHGIWVGDIDPSTLQENIVNENALWLDSVKKQLKRRINFTWFVDSNFNPVQSHLAISVVANRVMLNIGNAYKDVYDRFIDFCNEKHLLDFRDVKQARILFYWSYNGSGLQSVRWVNIDDESKILWESSGFNTNQYPGDSGWFDLPIWAVEEKFIKWQGKSAFANDDPIARGFKIYFR